MGVALLAGFVVHARRPGRAPAVDLRLFRHRPFTVASVLIFLSGASLFGLMFLLPAYYQQARGLDPLQAGLMLAPQGAGMVAALAIVGVLVDRFGPRAIVLAGIAITIAGTLPFTQAGIADDRPWSAAALVLRGLGLGAAAMPLTAAAYRELPKEEVPQAAGALVILQRLGASSGTRCSPWCCSAGSGGATARRLRSRPPPSATRSGGRWRSAWSRCCPPWRCRGGRRGPGAPRRPRRRVRRLARAGSGPVAGRVARSAGKVSGAFCSVAWAA
ncbi:MAG: MFS transporter [Thermobispora sp.]|nr:MFS transporter [Thermobispora sp.]